jgi:hypothetical protein
MRSFPPFQCGERKPGVIAGVSEWPHAAVKIVMAGRSPGAPPRFQPGANS